MFTCNLSLKLEMQDNKTGNVSTTYYQDVFGYSYPNLSTAFALCKFISVPYEYQSF
jgi:hypothetical protein